MAFERSPRLSGGSRKMHMWGAERGQPRLAPTAEIAPSWKSFLCCLAPGEPRGWANIGDKGLRFGPCFEVPQAWSPRPLPWASGHVGHDGQMSLCCNPERFTNAKGAVCFALKATGDIPQVWGRPSHVESVSAWCKSSSPRNGKGDGGEITLQPDTRWKLGAVAAPGEHRSQQGSSSNT